MVCLGVVTAGPQLLVELSLECEQGQQAHHQAVTQQQAEDNTSVLAFCSEVESGGLMWLIALPAKQGGACANLVLLL